MRVRHLFVSLLAVSAMLCLGSILPLFAQSTNTGTVVGTVTDPTGAVLSGATVALTDVTTNAPRTTTTNAAGRYIFVDVNPGVYNVSVSKSGFSTTKAQNQEVKVGGSVTLNLTTRSVARTWWWKLQPPALSCKP